MSKFNQEHNSNNLTTAIALLKTSYQIEPKNQNTLFKLSVCYFLKADCENARRFCEECKSLGGLPLTKEYIEALDRSCKKYKVHTMCLNCV